jgi:hypothetical protein
MARIGSVLQVAPATPASNAECLCITTRLAWHDHFPLILRHLSTCSDEDKLISILETLRARDPDTDDRQLSLLPARLGGKSFEMTLPPRVHALARVDSSRSLGILIATLNTTNILTLFAAALFDRRIIVTSSRLSSITGVIFGIIELL